MDVIKFYLEKRKIIFILKSTNFLKKDSDAYYEKNNEIK